MKLNKFTSVTFAVWVLFITASCNNDRNARSETTTTGDNRMEAENGKKSLTAMREENFVTDAIEANAEEMAWLRAGINTGTDEELKTHAKKMMSDHQQMDRDIRAYASSKNITLDNVDTSNAVRIRYDRGRKWDKEWADEMGDMHKSQIRKFERARKRIQDTELENMITKTLPVLHSHLAMVEKLEEKLDK